MKYELLRDDGTRIDVDLDRRNIKFDGVMQAVDDFDAAVAFLFERYDADEIEVVDTVYA